MVLLTVEEKILDSLFHLIVDNNCKLNTDVIEIFDSFEKLEKHVSTRYCISFLAYALKEKMYIFFEWLILRKKSNLYRMDSVMHYFIIGNHIIKPNILNQILNNFDFTYQNRLGDTVLHTAASYTSKENTYLEILLNHLKVTSNILNIQNLKGDTCLFNLLWMKRDISL